MTEEWRQLDWPWGEYDYLVSSEGRVARILGLQNDPRGYKATTLDSNQVPCGRARKYVHQLVAACFLPDPPGEIGRRNDQYQVHHVNGDKRDNRAENLAWVRKDIHDILTVKNGQHAYGERQGHAKLTAEQVVEARLRYSEGGITQKELADEHGVAQGTMSQAIRGKTWGHTEHSDSWSKDDEGERRSEYSAGEQNNRAKLTEDDVREMRRLYDAGEATQAELAERFPVSRTTVGYIVRRDTWDGVEP